MYDILIKNANIVDGSGKEAYKADIGILEGRIFDIGKITDRAKTIINANDKVCIPSLENGFAKNNFNSPYNRQKRDLTNRKGYIRRGYDADIIIGAYTNIEDLNELSKSFNRNQAIETLILNGKIVTDSKRFVG
ncbi:MAG: hypothetical protein Q4P29_05935 [Tissierellia bacterium]|nr:hypothetical protein [Tissierellia bacterium]